MRTRTTILINAASNQATVVLDTVVNLFVLGYLTRTLEAGAFGLVILALALPSMFELLGASLIKGTVRHAALAYEQRDTPRLSAIMSASVVLFGLIGVLAAAVSLVLGLTAGPLLDVPEELAADARYSFLAIAAFALISFPLRAFRGMLAAVQRFYCINMSRVAPLLLRAALIPAWFAIWGPSATGVIVVTMACRVIERISWWRFVKRYLPGVGLRLSDQVRPVAGLLLSFSAVAVMVDLGNILGYEGYKFVVGKSLSLEEVGLYGLYVTLASYSLVFARSGTEVLMPVASKFDATGDRSGNERLFYYSTKVSMMIFGLFCIASLPLLELFLRLWTSGKMGAAEHWRIAAVMLLTQAGVALASASGVLLSGIGRQGYMATTTLTCYAGAFIGGYLILTYAWPGLLTAVLIIGAAHLMNGLIRFEYGMRLMSRERSRLIVSAVARPVLAATLASLMLLPLRGWVNAQGFLGLFIGGLILTILYTACMYLIALETGERIGARRLIGGALIRVGRRRARYNG